MAEGIDEDTAGCSMVIAGACSAAYTVVGGDDSTLADGGVVADDVDITGEVEIVVLVLNLANTPVGEGAWLLTWVTGAWSLALAASGGVITEGRGLFSTIARISGDRDISSGV